MAKRKEVDKRSVSPEAKLALAETMLAEFLSETKTVSRDLEFLIQSSGTQIDELSHTTESLDRLEAFYRSAKQSGHPIDIDELERLVAIILGETIITRCGGHWIVYTGKYHVLKPFVLQLPNGKHVDTFLFCTSLWQKNVTGAQSGRALSYFVEHVEKFAFK